MMRKGVRGKVRTNQKSPKDPRSWSRLASWCKLKGRCTRACGTAKEEVTRRQKKAWEELQEAQEWLRQVKGPKPWWQEATRLQRQQSTAERARTKVGEKMDEEKEWFQDVASGHEERMEALRQK